MNIKLQCGCFGYFTVESLSDICQVCYWQHDFYQEKRMDDEGGT